MNTTTRLYLTLALLTLLLAPACGNESTPSPTPPTPTTPAAPAPTPAPSIPPSTTNERNSADPTTEIAGLKWIIPSAWQTVPATGMRLAEYIISADSGPDLATLRFFSTQGSAEMNIERWKGQVRDPTSGPTEKTIQATPLKASLLAITGSYSGMGPTGAQSPAKPNTRLLAAFIDGGPRPVQVLLSGPDDLVRTIEPAWEAMIAAARAE